MTEDVPDILDVADRYHDEDKLRRIGHGAPMQANDDYRVRNQQGPQEART